MIQLILFDNKGAVVITLDKGKKHTITRENMKNWNKIEVSEI